MSPQALERSLSPFVLPFLSGLVEKTLIFSPQGRLLAPFPSNPEETPLPSVLSPHIFASFLARFITQDSFPIPFRLSMCLCATQQKAESPA